MKPKDFVARLYILGGKDIVGPSDQAPDTYLKVMMGDNV